jgi:MYXO-CTERM domain-containing protein
MRGITILWLCLLWVAPASAQSAFVDGERVRLRAHFDEVLAELEAADTSALSADQRSRRAVHLTRLAAYRDRGVFPVRYGGPSGRVPEFRDVHGTRCAMGELIYLSGATQLVDDVATTANSATIAELSADPRLVQWLDHNGLSLEEAGRVQPGYAPWRGADCLCVDSTSQWSGVVVSRAVAGERWVDSDSGYDEYSVEVDLVDPIHGADGRAAGQRASVAIWYPAEVGQPVLVAFEGERGWALPVDDGFTAVACSIEWRSRDEGDTAITCENSAAVALDVALAAMELPQTECRAALPLGLDLAPCEEGGCAAGARNGTPTPHLALFAALAVVVATRRRRR